MRKLVFEEELESHDLDSALGVIKYDVADIISYQRPNNTHRAHGNFPGFIPKTDQNRIQNSINYFDVYKDHEFEETLKLDGSSMTCYKIKVHLSIFKKIKRLFGFKVPEYHFGVCSRNLELKPDYVSNFWKAARKYGIEAKLPIGYAIQGELVAPNIQSNHEKVHEVEFYVFDIYDITQQRYLTPNERYLLMQDELAGIPHVPVINSSVRIFEECSTLDDLLTRVNTESMNKGTISEGRVYKHIDNQDLSFKVINNNYLLKCEE